MAQIGEPWPDRSYASCVVRMTRMTIPQWLSEKLSLSCEDLVNTHQAKLSVMLSSPASFFIVSSPIPLPGDLYGSGAKLAPIRCRMTHVNLPSGEVRLVLHNSTKKSLLDAYNRFLETFPMRKVEQPMKTLLRSNLMEGVDAVVWRVGSGVLEACNSEGCGDLQEFYSKILQGGGSQGHRKRRGRPPKVTVSTLNLPSGLTELMEDVVEQIKSLFMPALPSDVVVSIWDVHWLVPTDQVILFVQDAHDSDNVTQNKEYLEVRVQEKDKEIDHGHSHIGTSWAFEHPANQNISFAPMTTKGWHATASSFKRRRGTEDSDIGSSARKKYKVFRPANISEGHNGGKIRYASTEESTATAAIEPDYSDDTMAELDPFGYSKRRWLGMFG